MSISARHYAELHRGTAGDIEFYATACVGIRSVLELGVGSARVLSRLDVPERWGLERDRHMLRLAEESALQRQAALELHQGDMAQFSLLRRFDRVIIPYNGLLCLPPDQQLSCLRCVRDHLQPGGRLLFDVYSADALHAEAESVSSEPEEDEPEFLVELSVDGVRYCVFERNRWWPSQQRLDVVYRWQPLADGEAPAGESTVSHYYLPRDQIEPLLGRAGLQLVDLGELAVGAQVTVTARA